MSYTLITGSSSVICDKDGAIIPDDPRNVDWQTYQAWIRLGNVPNVAHPPAVGPIISESYQSLVLARAKSLVAHGRPNDAIVALISLVEALT